MWDNNEHVVDWLEKQKDPNSTMSKNIFAVKKDAISSKIQMALEVSVFQKKEKKISAFLGLPLGFGPF